MLRKTNLFYRVLIIFACCMFSFACKNIRVKAIEYTSYDKGTIEETYKDIVVNSFDYDYTVKFSAESNWYNGLDVRDGEISLRDKTFYAGHSIVVNIDHYNHWLGLIEDSDVTYIYRFNSARNDFSKLYTFEDERTTVTLSEEGLYKVIYAFDGEIKYSNYIYISLDLHEYEMVLDEKYTNSSAFGGVSFNLKLVDAYDLRNYEYYYAFTSDKDSSRAIFRPFDIFTSEEKESSAQIMNINKNLTIALSESDDSDGEEKYLHIKVSKNINGVIKNTVILSDKKVVLTSKVQGNVFISNENGDIIRERAYYKNGDIAYFKVIFNAPVSYKNLQIKLGENDEYQLIQNQNNEVSEVVISVIILSNSNFVGNISFLTIDKARAIVVSGGNNVVLNVVKSYDFVVDVEAPNIEVNGEIETVAKKVHEVYLNIDDVYDGDNASSINSGVRELYYYASECKIAQSGICTDIFDDSNEYIRKIETIDTSGNAKIIIDERFGKFDNVEIALFVKAIDNAGNVSTIVEHGFLVDNVIIPDGDIEELMKTEYVYQGVEIVGQKLLVVVRDDYNISSINYAFEENDKNQCIIEDLSNLVYKCFEVNYDFIADAKINLVDDYGNEETYNILFKYSGLQQGNVSIGDKTFEIYTDKEYELYAQLHNVISTSLVSERIKFDEESVARFSNILSIDKIPDLTDLSKTLIFIENGEVIELLTNIGDAFDLPTNSEIIDKVSKYPKYGACALKGNNCELEVYLQYKYKANGVSQIRNIKMTLLDESNKFDIENFKEEIVLNVNEEFMDFEKKYVDNFNVELTEGVMTSKQITFNGEEVNDIDTSKIGTYTVRETFVYNGESSLPLIYSIKIFDNIAPTIRINGKETMTIRKGKNVDLLKDIIARDNYDTEVEIKYTVTPDFDSNTLGQYVVSYWAIDGSGNVSSVITRNVEVVGQSNKFEYLIVVSIVIVVLGVMTLGIIIEVKKQRKIRHLENN